MQISTTTTQIGMKQPYHSRHSQHTLSLSHQTITAQVDREAGRPAQPHNPAHYAETPTVAACLVAEEGDQAAEWERALQVHPPA